MDEQALGRWAQAERHLEEAIEIQDPWVKKNQSVLDESLRAVRRHVAQLELRGEPAGAEVLVGGAPAGTLPLPRPMRLAEGEVALELRAPGHQPERRTFTLAGGETKVLSISLAKVAPPPAPPPPPAADLRVVAPPPRDDSPAPGRPYRLAAASAAAVGVAGLVGGVVMSLRVKDLEDQVKEARDDAKVADLNDQGTRAQRFQWIGYGVGAAGLAGGGLLWWLGARADRPEGVALAPLVTPGTAGALLRGAF
jgi:hypothetical protein